MISSGVAAHPEGSKRLTRDKDGPTGRSRPRHTTDHCLPRSTCYIDHPSPSCCSSHLLGKRDCRQNISHHIVACACCTAARSAVPRHSTSECLSALLSPPRLCKSASLVDAPTLTFLLDCLCLVSQAAAPLFASKPGRLSSDPGTAASSSIANHSLGINVCPLQPACIFCFDSRSYSTPDETTYTVHLFFRPRYILEPPQWRAPASRTEMKALPVQIPLHPHRPSAASTMIKIRSCCSQTTHYRL